MQLFGMTPLEFWGFVIIGIIKGAIDFVLTFPWWMIVSFGALAVIALVLPPTRATNRPRRRRWRSRKRAAYDGW